MTFDQNDVAVINGQKHMCIICDRSIAVLGRMEPIEGGGHSVKYENCSIYSNRDDFRGTISGLERIEDIFGNEKTKFAEDPQFEKYEEFCG